jgi:hypothetical protein
VYVVGETLVTKISSIGVVTTFAGVRTTAGTADGQGTSASFGVLRSIVVDTNLNLYVTDYTRNNIRMITSSGFVTTMAGSKSGTSGSADGQGTAAGFYTNFHIALDSNAHFYISEYNNCKLRKMSPSGFVSTFAGRTGVCTTLDGVGTLATFQHPIGLVVDKQGNVYVETRNGGNRLRKITSSGSVTTLAGTGASSAIASDGFGTSAVLDFDNDFQLAIDINDNIYLAATYYIRKMTSSGAVTTIWYHPTNDIHRGIAVDSSSNLYVSEYGYGRVWKISQAGGSEGSLGSLCILMWLLLFSWHSTRFIVSAWILHRELHHVHDSTCVHVQPQCELEHALLLQLRQVSRQHSVHVWRVLSRGHVLPQW